MYKLIVTCFLFEYVKNVKMISKYVDKKESRYVDMCQNHDFDLVASIFEAHKCIPI